MSHLSPVESCTCHLTSLPVPRRPCWPLTCRFLSFTGSVERRQLRRGRSAHRRSGDSTLWPLNWPYSGGEGTRTLGLYIANVALYQLSYTPGCRKRLAAPHRVPALRAGAPSRDLGAQGSEEGQGPVDVVVVGGGVVVVVVVVVVVEGVVVVVVGVVVVVVVVVGGAVGGGTNVNTAWAQSFGG